MNLGDVRWRRSNARVLTTLESYACCLKGAILFLISRCKRERLGTAIFYCTCNVLNYI